MWAIARPPHWVGRTAELGVLRQATAALRDGAGSVLWIEGEPGIGKSSLVAEGLAGTGPGWEAGWGMAERLTQRLPLRVMLDCLQVRAGSPDPRRAHAAGLLRTALARRGGTVLTLGPLPETEMDLLVTALAGVPPTATRRQLTAQAEGNPLYARELVDALRRDQAGPLPGSLARVLALLALLERRGDATGCPGLTTGPLSSSGVRCRHLTSVLSGALTVSRTSTPATLRRRQA
jgi:hypothetical protein